MDEVRSYVRLDLPSDQRQGRPKDCSASFSNPMMEGPGADSEEKHEPASDVDTALVDRLKALDPNRPIREADIGQVYSITSPARASTAGGTVRPRAFAVLRLIASSYLVAACTGSSAGFSPLRMRST